jgi:signal peptidase II
VFDLLAAGSVVLFLDQWSKRFVELRAGPSAISLGPLLRIRHARSTREFYARDSARIALVVVWLSALVSGIMLHSAGVSMQGHTAMLGLGTAVGGAAGNLYDILRRRHVVDFIDLGWWPVFNLADVAIVAGLVLALWPST